MTTMDVGSARIDPVLDGILVARPEDVLRRPGVVDPWMPHRDLLNAGGDLEMPVGGFLIRTGKRVILSIRRSAISRKRSIAASRKVFPTMRLDDPSSRWHN